MVPPCALSLAQLMVQFYVPKSGPFSPQLREEASKHTSHPIPTELSAKNSLSPGTDLLQVEFHATNIQSKKHGAGMGGTHSKKGQVTG